MHANLSRLEHTLIEIRKAHAGIAGLRIFARIRNVAKYLPRILGFNCQRRFGSTQPYLCAWVIKESQQYYSLSPSRAFSSYATPSLSQNRRIDFAIRIMSTASSSSRTTSTKQLHS